MKSVNTWAKNALIALLALTIASCGHRRQEVHFARLEQVVFETPADRLQSELLHRQGEFDTRLLNIDPTDGQYMQMLAGFAADPTMRHIYATVDSLYRDLGWLEKELGAALGRTDAVSYDRFFTLVSGDFYDYDRRIFCSDHELAISLDHYAVGELRAGVPAYIEHLSHRKYIAADCMAAIARAHIALPEGELTLLDYAIAEGKVLYFLHQTLPHTADTILLRYTADQLDWMQSNTANVWGWLLQNKMLYSNDLSMFHNLIDEAPKTNAFGDGSAPRTPFYIGWKIVDRYMHKSGATMQELFDETDSQKILTTAAWRP